MLRDLIVAFCFVLSTRVVLAQNCGSLTTVGCFCYSFNATAVTNDVAKAQCASTGSNCRLPFFPTTQDMIDLRYYVWLKNLPTMWIGYWNPNPHTQAAPGVWTDQLLNPAPFTNWAGPEPNDGADAVGSHCVWSYAGGSGQWNDIPCTWTLPYACQCHWTQCPSLFTGPTGTYPDAPYLSCTTYTYTCNSNYIVDLRNSTSDIYTCLANGTWDKTFIPCVFCLISVITSTTSTSTSSTSTTTTASTTTSTTTTTASTTTPTTTTTTTSTTTPTTTTTTTSTTTPTATTTTTSTTSASSSSTTTPSATFSTITTITPTTTTTCVTTTFATSLAQDSGNGLFSSNFAPLPIADLTAFLAAANYSKSDYPRNFRGICIHDMNKPSFNWTFISDTPTEINTSVQIAKLSSVSESSNTFEVDLSVTLAWNDHRLNFAKGNGSMASETFQLTNANDQDLLWRPTLFIVNAQSVLTPKVLVKNTVSFVQSDGTVIMQQRVLATASCPMKLSNYPFDTQNCFIKLSLYGYFVSQLTLNWKYPVALEQSGQTNSTPLSVPPDFSLPNFDIPKIVIGIKRDNVSQDVYCGIYRPCLFLQFTLGRKVSYHVFRTYLPSTFVLIVSWISFWIHPQNVPARFGLGVTAFLTLQTASANTQARLPAISYLTALDVWLLYCQISVLLCLVEFTFVHTLTTRLWSYNGVRDSVKSPWSRFVGLFSMSNTKSTQTVVTEVGNGKFYTDSTATETVGPSHYKSDQNYLDYLSRRIFPLSFALFIIVYLVYYLI